MQFQIHAEVGKDEYLEFNRYFIQKQKPRNYISMGLLSLVIAGVFSFLMKDSAPMLPVFLIAFAVFFGGVMLTVNMRINKALAEAVGNEVYKDLSQDYTFSESSFECSKGDHPVAYEEITSQLLLETCLLLELANGYFYLVPIKDLSKEQLDFIQSKINH